jgi:chromatin remodeling complex protein RSC6
LIFIYKIRSKMAPAKKSTKTETPVTETPVVPAPSKTEAKKSESKKADSKKPETKASESKKTDKKAPKPQVEEPAPKTPRKKVEKQVEAEDAEQAEKKSGPRVKRVVTKESLDADCTKFSELILAEISKIRDADQKPKVKGIRLLRTLHKEFRQLHKDVNKMTRFKKNNNRKNNTTSGFLKPVKITPEMAKFLGWDANKEYSRTQVTKEICVYIEKHSLNDPANRRNINCDPKLKTLLKYDASTAPKDEDGKALPLTYFRLQQYLKHHFIKPVEVDAELDEE